MRNCSPFKVYIKGELNFDILSEPEMEHLRRREIIEADDDKTPHQQARHDSGR